MMKYSLVYPLGIVLLLPCICASLVGDDDASNSSYSRCPYNFRVLEKALYETEGNMVNMLAIFSPARKTQPSFVRVHYAFKDENGTVPSINNCTVQYLWVKGGFLFVQPPTIFQFSSLLFYFTGFRDDAEINLYLTLPFECRPLIVKLKNKSCTCRNSSSLSTPLEELTDQLRVYAKYGSPENVEREIATSSYSICEDRLKKRYYEETEHTNSFNVHVALKLLPFLPFLFIALVGSVTRSVNKKIHLKLIDAESHSTTVGIILTGMFISFFILFCDILAVHYATSERHEFGDDHVSDSFNITITWVIFVFDLIVCIIPLTVLLYICCTHINEDECCCCCEKDKCCGFRLMNYILFCIFYPYVYTISGERKLDKDFWNIGKSAISDSEDEEVNRNARTLWIVSCAAIAPLFTIPSHIIFILAAWLTDPPQATSIALVAIGIFLYFFLSFRQCYAINKDFKTKCCCWSLFLPLYPIWAFIKYVGTIFCIPICCKDVWADVWFVLKSVGYNICCLICCKDCFSNFKTNSWMEMNGTEEESLPFYKATNEKVSLQMDNKKFFNTKSFCIAYVWGWVLVGVLAFFLTALLELPIAVFSLPNYLLNILQVLIVVISLLITYKIVVSGVPAVLKFLQSLRLAYENDKKNEDILKETKDKDEIEAGGLILGKLARVVVLKYEQS